MCIESLIAYGYPIILLGAMMEGETIIIAAGFLAHRGYLSLPLVALLAFTGAFISDQFFFHVGRKADTAFLQRHPRLKKRTEVVQQFICRYQNIMVVGFRFVYGTRIATPLALGMNGFSVRRFLLLDAIGVSVWATLTASAGYFFGQALELMLVRIKRHEKRIVLGILLAGLIVWLFNSIRVRLGAKNDEKKRTLSV